MVRVTWLLLPAAALAALPFPPAFAASGAAVTDHVWPVTGPPGGRRAPTVVRGFEPPPHPWSPGHRGVDLAALPGAPVRAVASGRVVFAGTVAGRGVLSVELPGTGPPASRYTYQPVRPRVRPGDLVAAGTTVASLAAGPFHCRTACLHWGLLRGRRYLDPLGLLPPSARFTGPSRLLPVRGVAPPGPDRAGGGPAPRRADAGAAGGAETGASPAGTGAGTASAGLAAAALAIRVRRRGRRRAGPAPPRYG